MRRDPIDRLGPVAELVTPDVDRAATSDRVQPRAELTGRVEARRRPPGLQQRDLHRFLGEGAVAAEPVAGRGMHAGPVPLVDRIQDLGVAGREPPGQIVRSGTGTELGGAHHPPTVRSGGRDCVRRLPSIAS